MKFKFKLWNKKNNGNMGSNRTEPGLAQLNKCFTCQLNINICAYIYVYIYIEREIYKYICIYKFHSHISYIYICMSISPTHILAHAHPDIFYKLCMHYKNMYIQKYALRVCELCNLWSPLLNTNCSSDAGDIWATHTYRSHRNTRGFLFQLDIP